MSVIEGELREQLSKWVDSGYDDKFLLPQLKAGVAKLWLYHHKEIENGRDELNALIVKSVEVQGYVWNVRSICNSCFERYRLENMDVCTDCLVTYCYRCIGGIKMAANGKCYCGGEFY